MANYYIKHKCGHELKVNIGGPEKERESKVRWYETTLCKECYFKDIEDQKEAANAKAALAAKEQELPELIGSIKQISYGETCRQELIDKITVISNRIKAQLVDGTVHPPEIIERGAGLITLLDTNLEYIKVDKKEASWWIDKNKTATDSRSIKLFMDVIALERDRAVATPEVVVPVPEKPIEVSEVVRPENPVSELIAHVRVANDIVEVHYPTRDDKLIAIVKDLGFEWDSGRWSRKINTFSGPIVDRAAEVGHSLLAAGFIVKTGLKDKVISASYTPEHTNWIKAVTRGEYTGWFVIKWSKRDDYYAAARKIKGSRYDRPNVVIPAEQFEELLDFAEIYGFKLSEGANELLELARDKKNEQLMATVPDPIKKESVVAGSKKPPKLKVAEVEIDAEFRDGD